LRPTRPRSPPCSAHTLRPTSACADAETVYRLGGGTLQQVEQTQRTQSRARAALAEVQGDRYRDLVQLYAATAADWRTGVQTVAAP
jgi:outer membrane protein TolC